MVRFNGGLQVFTALEFTTKDPKYAPKQTIYHAIYDHADVIL